jgi:predicted metal-dependent enzyme (double-stranded beta helix superfamily)
MTIDNLNKARFSGFLASFDRVIDQANGDEATILKQGGDQLQQLVSHDDWLPEFCSEPHPQHYMQYLLYCDPNERYSVVSFVWGPGQSTPVHDHTVWGLIGMLRGAEVATPYENTNGDRLLSGEKALLKAGDVDCVSPRLGDIHKVSNAFDDQVSISIHIYGGNIGKVKRHVFSEADGTPKEFISGYASNVMPNFWGG